MGTVLQVSRTMADWCAVLCYVENKHAYNGMNALAAYNHLYPEHGGKLKLAPLDKKLHL